MKNRLRVSQTLFWLWEQSRTDDAVRYYFKLGEIPKTQAQIDGIMSHKDWEKHILKNKTLPNVFGSVPLKDPKCELKLVLDGSKIAPEYNWLEIVIIADCVDEPTCHEFKSGSTNVGHYEQTLQIGLYPLVLRHLGYNVDRVMLHTPTDSSLIWVTNKLLEKTLDYVTQVGWEIKSYFDSNDLWKLNGKERNEPLAVPCKD